LAAASLAALSAAAPAAASSPLLHLLLASPSLLFPSLLVSCFLPGLRVPGKLEGDTVAVADVEMLLQQKLSSSSPSNVSRVSKAHLPSILQPLYEFQEVYKGGGGAVPSWGVESFWSCLQVPVRPPPHYSAFEFQATS
jgi:hypothetical protein